MIAHDKNMLGRDDGSIYQAFRPFMFYSVLVGETPMYYHRTSSGELKVHISEISLIFSLLSIGFCSYLLNTKAMENARDGQHTPFHETWWFYAIYSCVLYFQTLCFYKDRYSLLKLILNEKIIASTNLTINAFAIILSHISLIMSYCILLFFNENEPSLSQSVAHILPITYLRTIESLKILYLTAELYFCSNSFSVFNFNVGELRDYVMRPGTSPSQPKITAKVQKLSQQYARACGLCKRVARCCDSNIFVLFFSNFFRWSYIVYITLRSFQKIISEDSSSAELVVTQNLYSFIFKWFIYYIPIHMSAKAMREARASIPVIHEVILRGDELRIDPDTFTYLAIQIDKLAPSFKVCGMFIVDFDFFLVIISNLVTNTLLFLQLKP